MCNKYKDTKPSFHAYVNKELSLHAYRYFEKMTRDPVNRNSISLSTKIKISSSNSNTDSFQSELKDVIPDTTMMVESDYTVKTWKCIIT
jgi:hypothetical protein